MLLHPRIFKLTAAALMLCTLMGCFGFKLRGSYTFPEYIRTIYLTPADQYDAFQRELRFRLHRNGIHIVCQPGALTTSLNVSKPEIRELVLAYNSSGQVQRSRLFYTVKYELTVKGKEGFQIQRSITRTRELSKTGNALLTNESEEQIVRKELLTETVNELLRQLARPINNATILDTTTIDDNPC